jgi:hypothetical protein
MPAKPFVIALIVVCGTIGAYPMTGYAAPQGHYCNLKVFSPTEWDHHRVLTRVLAAAIAERQELENGY